jgi:hypothetical protein
MTDKNSIMRGFNDTFFDFLEDIIRIIPNSANIVSAKHSFSLIRMANPSAIIKVWYKNIYTTYQTQIDAGDLDFFFEKDYSGDLHALANSDEIIKIIDSIRQPLRNISESNKEHTKNYIRILSKLSLAYSTF